MLAVALLGVLAPAVVTAQAVAVTAVSGLQFGLLLPGVSTRVAPADAARRAELMITGAGRVDVRFVLPTQMTSPDGDVLPLAFANGDGAVSTTRNPALAAFDPNATLRTNLTANGVITRLFLGGTATPPTTQFPGNYTATVSVVITGAN